MSERDGGKENGAGMGGTLDKTTPFHPDGMITAVLAKGYQTAGLGRNETRKGKERI